MKETATTSRPRLAPSSPHRSVAATTSGQCHRYNEYDSPPSHTAGRQESSLAGPGAPGTKPAAMTAAVPRVGNSAAEPGQVVAEEITKPLSATAPSPAQPSTAASSRGRRPQWVAPIATSAPIPNSQSRVVVTKNAAAGFASDRYTDHASEGTTSRRIPAVITGRTRSRLLRRTSQPTSTSSSGHTM